MEKMSNKLYFEESIHRDFSIRLQMDKILAQEDSEFQSILIFTNGEFGKCMALDGVLQLTSADEHIYHEMMAHVPLMAMARSDPLKVAIIGGGDGGVLREVVKHPGVESVTLIDIDKRVIELSRELLPEISDGSFEHPKATVLSEDGAEWVRNNKGLDLVLIDSSDPVGPSASLFNDKFYSDLCESLNPGGVVVKQSGCSLVQPDEVIDTMKFYKKYFASFGVYTANVPTYVGGDMCFAWAAKGHRDLARAPEEEVSFSTKYYHRSVHHAAFALPREMQKKILEVSAIMIDVLTRLHIHKNTQVPNTSPQCTPMQASHPTHHPNAG